MRTLHALDLVPWSAELNAIAATLAAERLLRPGEACYLAAAHAAGATLITLDVELQQRGKGAARVLTPAEWLARVAS